MAGMIEDIKGQSLTLRERRIPEPGKNFLLAAERTLWSIPQVGIQTGRLGQLERELTPSYIDKFISNVISALVTFE